MARRFIQISSDLTINLDHVQYLIPMPDGTVAIKIQGETLIFANYPYKRAVKDIRITEDNT